MNILIILLWIVLSTMAFLPYAAQLEPLATEDKIMCIFIFAVGGPFFAVAEILGDMLTYILGDGWNDENPKGH